MACDTWQARGAKIYGELVGYGATADGYDMVAPSGKGGQRAMEVAMAMANELGGEKPIDCASRWDANPQRLALDPIAEGRTLESRVLADVNTHGTSTPVGDTMELKAIKDAFSPLGYQPYVGSTKSLTGHAVGAAGVHEAIYSWLTMAHTLSDHPQLPVLRPR